MSKSDYLEQKLLNHVLRGIPYSAPPAVYMALYAVNPPTDAGGGTEVSGGSYTRQTVTFGVPVGDTSSNSADVLYPVATVDWGNIVAFGIFDAAVAGNLLHHALLTAPRNILATDQLRFPAGSISISES